MLIFGIHVLDVFAVKNLSNISNIRLLNAKKQKVITGLLRS